MVVLKNKLLEVRIYFCFPTCMNTTFHFADPLKTPLDWRTRRQIAIGVAAALVSVRVSNHKRYTSYFF